MKPNELKAAIELGIDELMLGDKQSIGFEGIYSHFYLVRSHSDAISVVYETTPNKDSLGDRTRLASFSTKIGLGKLRHLIYEVITIKDFGGKI